MDGSGSKRSVNDVWAELQRATAPRGRLGGGLGAISYVQRAQAPKQPKGPGFIEGLEQQQQQQHRRPSSSAEPDDTAMASLQRDINCLGDRDRRLRVKALESLSAKLLGPPTTPAPPQLLQAALAGPLLVPLVRLLADPAEKCRELAAEFLSAAVQRLPNAGGALLPTLVPALAERVGGSPVEEPSEEIRLLLAQLAGGIVARYAEALGGGGRGSELLAGVVQVVCRGLEDSYPDIKKVACTSLAQLAASSSVNVEALEPHLDALLASLLPLLQHPHSRVRLAALEALHALVTKGLRHQALEQRVAPAVQPLVEDHAPGVRGALFASAAQWMGNERVGMDPDGRLASQCRAAVPLFLPTLLLALTDEQEGIRSSAVPQMEGVAAAYLAMQGKNELTEMDIGEEERWPHWGQVAGRLPGYSHPFQDRPSPAARGLVQSELPRLVPLVAQGAVEWTTSLRLAAARLLHAALVYAEAAALQHLPSVLQSLRAGVADDDAGVAARALAAAHVLGVNVPTKYWAPFAVEAVTAEQLSAAQRATGLHVLSALLHAAGAAGQPANRATVQLLAAALGHEQLLAAGDAPKLQPQLLAAACSLVLWGKQECQAVAPDLLCLLLRIAAAEHSRVPAGVPVAEAAAGSSAPLAAIGPTAKQLTAAGVIGELAAACGLRSAQELCDQLAPRLLLLLCQGHESWHRASPNWRAFASLLRYCGPDALAAGAGEILGVLRSLGGGHDKDPDLRLAALVLVDELLQDGSKAPAWQAGLAAVLAEQVLLPALVWRAGNPAAAARYAALTALATMLKGRLLAEGALLRLVQEARLLPLLFQCLDEDYMAETRLLACQAIQSLLQAVGRALPPEQLRSVQPALLQRLDDSSNPVRVAACAALLDYLPCLAALAGVLEEGTAAQLAASLLVHMDDSDPAVQEAACGVLEALAKLAPGAVWGLAAAVVGVHRSRGYLDRVLAVCGPA